MAEAKRNGGWARKLTWLALALSIGGLAAALIAAVGSGQELWHFRVGFTILRYAFYAAIAGGLLAIIAWIGGRRSGAGLGRYNLLAFFVALGFVAYLGSHIATARSVPAIHDVTTNLEDMPQFSALKVREDNLENIPDNDDPRLKAMDPANRWKALHRQGYPDLHPIRVPWSVEETIRRAEAVARERDWEIVKSDPKAGVLEATDTTFFFRFKDDVVLRARPYAEAKGGTQVDMRSISRVGGSDVGMNAKRIRAFLKDLQQS
jgi:uncharacterized protein (DUF1499 family)